MSLLRKLFPSPTPDVPSTSASSVRGTQTLQPASSMDAQATFLSLEREIDRLTAENRALYRENETLHARLAPSQSIVDQLRHELEKRDRIMARLASDIREAVANYEKALEIYEDKLQQRGLTTGQDEAAGYARLIDQLQDDILTWCNE